MGKVLHPREIDSVYIRLGQEWPSNQKIRPMGKYKFLVTFFTKEDLGDALVSGSSFLQSVSTRTGNGLLKKHVKLEGFGLNTIVYPFMVGPVII